MPANGVFRKVVLGTEYAPISEASLIADITIIALSTNTGSAFFQSDGDVEPAVDVELEAGQQVTLLGVDLSEILVKGTASDVLSIIGGTRS